MVGGGGEAKAGRPGEAESWVGVREGERGDTVTLEILEGQLGSCRALSR